VRRQLVRLLLSSRQASPPRISRDPDPDSRARRLHPEASESCARLRKLLKRGVKLALAELLHSAGNMGRLPSQWRPVPSMLRALGVITIGGLLSPERQVLFRVAGLRVAVPHRSSQRRASEPVQGLPQDRYPRQHPPQWPEMACLRRG